jgi:hypothetical protein
MGFSMVEMMNTYYYQKDWEIKDIPTQNKFNKIVFLHEHFEYQEFDSYHGNASSKMYQLYEQNCLPTTMGFMNFDITFFSAQY